MTDTAATIRSLLGADPTPEQQDAADALLAALAPPMEEPEWPSAAVMAKCGASASAHTLHVRAPGRGIFQWTCVRGVFRWEDLIDPRPLTPAEYEKYGIPMPCDHVADGGTVERATQAFREHQGDVPESMRAALVAAGFKSAGVVPAVVPLFDHEKDSTIRTTLRAAGHPEATP